MIEDFLEEDFTLKPLDIKSFDYDKILALSDRDFAKFYHELMAEYRDKDGWWSEGKVPHCSHCRGVIPGPEKLRRLWGNSLHAECFGTVYEKDPVDGIEGRYFERVKNLI